MSCVSNAAFSRKAGNTGRKVPRAVLDDLSTSASSGSDTETIPQKVVKPRNVADKKQATGLFYWLLSVFSCARRSPHAAVAKTQHITEASVSTTPQKEAKAETAADSDVSEAETAEPQICASSTEPGNSSSDEDDFAESPHGCSACLPQGFRAPPGLEPPAALGFSAPPGLPPPPGLVSPPPGLFAPPGLAPPPGLEPAPFERRAFRKQLTKILRELSLSSNSGSAVQQVRDQRVPINCQKDEYVDILTRVMEMHTGAHRRLAMAFVAGLSAGSPAAFDRMQILAGIAEFMNEVVPSLADEVHGLQSIMRSELVPSLASVFSKAELAEVLPEDLRSR